MIHANAQDNDRIRKGWFNPSCVLLCLSAPVHDWISNPADFAAILSLVETFDDFDSGTNPDRSYGAFTYRDQALLWKIDRYERVLPG